VRAGFDLLRPGQECCILIPEAAIAALLLIPALVWAQRAPTPGFSDERAHVRTIHKTLPLNMPNGENGCVGTGTAVLNGK
jgi:hypothetical protein